MKLSLGVFITVFVSKPFYQATQLPILQLLSFNTWTGKYEYIFGVVEPTKSEAAMRTTRPHHSPWPLQTKNTETEKFCQIKVKVHWDWDKSAL